MRRMQGWLGRPRNPLLWALPIQAFLLLWHLDLLEPWRDEWFTLRTAPLALDQIRTIAREVGHPPLYFFLAHYWICIPLPMSELWKLRAMSALWAIAAAIVFHRLWLRREDAGCARIAGVLFALSPCLLLYGRMARSYSMQLAIALIAFAAALRWIENPRSVFRMAAYAAGAAALLYTHYLPGLALIAAASFAFASRAMVAPRLRAAPLFGSVGLVAILYAPSLPSLADAIDEWMRYPAIPDTSVLIDQIIRLAWWFVSFSFGETLSLAEILIGVILSPIVVWAVITAARRHREWLGMIALAGAIAYIGVSRWTGYPFTPARVLFLLPFFLILVADGIGGMRLARAATGVLVLAYALGDYSYFARTGFLNKEYCVPYSRIAETINADSPPGSILVTNGYDTFAEPLLPRLKPEVRVIALDDDTVGEVKRAIGGPAPVVWFFCRSHDESPGRVATDLIAEAGRARPATLYGYLPYSALERRILTWLRGPEQPAYSYLLWRFPPSDKAAAARKRRSGSAEEAAQEDLHAAQVKDSPRIHGFVGAPVLLAPPVEEAPQHRPVHEAHLHRERSRAEKLSNLREIALHAFVAYIREDALVAAIDDRVRRDSAHRLAHQVSGYSVARLHLPRNSHQELHDVRIKKRECHLEPGGSAHAGVPFHAMDLVAEPALQVSGPCVTASAEPCQAGRRETVAE